MSEEISAVAYASCPFCRARNGNRRSVIEMNRADHKCWWVSCEFCHATGPSKESKGEAMSAWNECAARAWNKEAKK